ncbi:hypothetical protein LSH36_878g01004 [Paralvinella palmiformis]|uniref:Integrator complex subunit 14 n=1 Tax=Paralvinella palmiformis TaxID=53620 RepID=A0AAD9MT18_9ANNE|nr:hypothetical protein LSH36_878g01004 [Paralvinella palmiformis]
MPTVILFDCSLSMSRPVCPSDNNDDIQRKHLAINGINTLLDYLTEHCKLEFVSLVEFSSTASIQVPFTRDHELIRAALSKTETRLGDKTCIETALNTVSMMVLDEWGVHTPCQILLISDGSTGVGQGCLRESLLSIPRPSSGDDKLLIPFSFTCKLHILCIAPPNEQSLNKSLPLYRKLIDISGGRGEIFLPEKQLTKASVLDLFSRVTEKYYAPFLGTLKCGDLKCNMQLFPAPEPFEKDHEFERIEKSVSHVIEVVGFMDIGDIASPPYISRHLVLPVSTSPENGGEHVKDEEEDGDGKQAAFTVLLHGSLKVEGMVALTQLADEWFGMIYSWADSKKKSNLMLSVFEPGTTPIPWLGNLTHLAPTDDFPIPPYGEDESKSPFPVRPSERRSYAQNCVVWLKQTGIQADIQKILRNARKLPEKQQQFYKELNRLRRAALAYGFHDLMSAVAQLLQRECTMLPGNAHPDAALQLTHASNSLKNDKSKDVIQNILPLKTNFSGD